MSGEARRRKAAFIIDKPCTPGKERAHVLEQELHGPSRRVGGFGRKEGSPLLADYHMHLEKDSVTEDCRFAPDRVMEYAAAAAAAGLAEIGISEHCHRFRQFRPIMSSLLEPQLVAGGWWLPDQFNYDLDGYVAAVLTAAGREAPVAIRLGLEVDYIPGREDDIRALLAGYPWDYVIGSVHFLPGWAIDVSPQDGWPHRDVDQAYRDYFQFLMEAAATGLFDIMAHPDLIKKFGHRPSFDLTPLYREAAEVFARAGVTAELSTAGWHVPVGEAYPAPQFLEILAGAGVPISLGSDAHDPAHVGRDFRRAVQLARRCGYREHSGFVRRERRAYPLP